MARPSLPVNAHRSPAPRHFRAALALAALVALGGCSIFAAPVVQRGNRVSEDQLREITPGVQTRADVQAVLGSPSASSTFDNNSWYYISSTTRIRPGRSLSVSDQKVVVVEFDNRGTVTAVRELDEDAGQSVAFVDRETPVPGNDRTTLQALFGNIGRYTAPGTGGSAPAAGGAAGPSASGR